MWGLGLVELRFGMEVELDWGLGWRLSWIGVWDGG